MASRLRESIDNYLTDLVGILDKCSTLRNEFKTAMSQDFNYWQLYRSGALKVFNSIGEIERASLRTIDALDDIRHADEEINSDLG